MCLPGSMMGHGGMSLLGRPLSQSFDDGGVVASLDEVREEEGAWAPPGWRWVCLDGGEAWCAQLFMNVHARCGFLVPNPATAIPQRRSRAAWRKKMIM